MDLLWYCRKLSIVDTDSDTASQRGKKRPAVIGRGASWRGLAHDRGAVMGAGSGEKRRQAAPSNSPAFSTAV